MDVPSWEGIAGTYVGCPSAAEFASPSHAPHEVWQVTDGYDHHTPLPGELVARCSQRHAEKGRCMCGRAQLVRSSFQCEWMRTEFNRLASMQGAAGVVVHYSHEDSAPRTRESWGGTMHSVRRSCSAISELHEGEPQQECPHRFSNDGTICHIPEDHGACVDGEWTAAVPQDEGPDWCGEEGLKMTPDLDSIHMADGMQRQASESAERSDEGVTGQSATRVAQQEAGPLATGDAPRVGQR